MNVAILGFGVVGSGVAEVITKNAEVIKGNSNVDLTLKYILDIRDFEGSEFASLMTKNFDDILNDDTVDIVVETMGGVNPAFEFVSKCLKKGKHVVTSNKELVAKKGYELLTYARENNVNFMFEASVGGGIPIIRPISRCLAGNRISEIAGILNGTTNFILNKMIVDKMNFDDALKLAQEKGYAEKDPTADVEGFDACRKICILASLAFGSHVYPDGVYTEGISKITLEDVECASELGYVIKLLARTKMLESGKISIMVSPALVKKESMLAGVNGVFNACLVRGDATGDVLMYGKGAGKLATASAVVGDVIDCASHADNRKFFGWGDEKENFTVSHLDAETSLFVRVKADDTASAKEKIASTFPSCDITEKKGELMFITDIRAEKELTAALEKTGLDVISTIRVTDY
ncbi:MAG: homoserine dehydrogenase [Faecalibacterium sp.]|nr:homoserine dehydrogenase [Ruminococcus sp.]MCM1391461.1 homoserine dehydrogenase [Ruminococcus sp.]MCM1485281.1 homoserine dehydrogenase [Faecalibacterium sp.]